MVVYCTTDPSDAPEKDRDCVSLVDPVARRSELLLLSGRGARGSRCRCTEECDFCEDGRLRLLRERRLCMEFALWLAEDTCCGMGAGMSHTTSSSSSSRPCSHGATFCDIVCW